MFSIYSTCVVQELQTEMVAKVPGGTHDTKECNTPTDSVNISVSVKTCPAFVGDSLLYQKSKYMLFSLKIVHLCILSCPASWSILHDVRNGKIQDIWSVHIQTLTKPWGVVFHQNILPVLMWGNIQEKWICVKKTNFPYKFLTGFQFCFWNYESHFN